MRFIDLFCGMGTIRMGFEQAGHECVYAVEWDKHKRRIYEVIFGHEPQGRDITDTRATDFPAADCWCFGAPCQDFSIAGVRHGMEGDRSSLVREVFRLVRETPKEHRPEWLLYENVKGMLSSNKGFDYLEILSEMGELGYDIEWQLLNTKNFGVPQNRERVFTLGHLRERGRRKVFPIREISNGTLRQLNNPTHSTNRLYDVSGIGRCLRAEAGGKGAKTGLYCDQRYIDGISDDYRFAKKRCQEMYDEAGELPDMFNPYNKQKINGIAPTLTSSCDRSCSSATVLMKQPNYRIRRLTPKECMRLQGVPDEVTDKLIAAGISDAQLYRAAGDACTVNVIYEIAKKLET